MNSRQHISSNTLKPVTGKNGSPELSELSGMIAGNRKATETQLMLQLHEMEERNNLLEQLVEQQTKELAEAIETNNKSLTIIAHDLRGPFCSILGVLGLLQESMDDYNKKEIKNFVDIASDSAKKTLSLLDNLLTWTIAKGTEKSMKPIKINIHELIKEEMDFVQSSAKQKKITLNHSFAKNLNVSADLQMVKTILRNLIGNAIKYTNTGGEVTVMVSESQPLVEISIKDNGIGMTDKVQKKLFRIDAFQSTPGTRNEKGTGLGLLLCKEFVELHGGTISIKSKPGKGSEFKITLPRYI